MRSKVITGVYDHVDFIVINVNFKHFSFNFVNLLMETICLSKMIILTFLNSLSLGFE